MVIKDRSIILASMVNIVETPRIIPISDVNCSQEKTEKYKMMTARAVLICRPNSHPFPERTFLLDQPVKIGRSVAKAKPAATNAIFDCKVLSRNHAILWYENGKFYLKDTKSSNGTFVNNQRLSKGSEESLSREVCSSDIVQFGVDVVEDFKKVSHGCVIATLKLYLPDGQEAKASSVTAESGSVCAVTLQDLYVLRSILEEANLREQQIKAKLAALMTAVKSAYELAYNGWNTMVDEDILLQRLELLQSQLAILSKNYPEGDAKADVRQLQEEKGQIEINAKQSVAKILKEKFEIQIQCADFDRKTTSMNIELETTKDLLESYKTEIDELLERQDIQTFEIQELTDQLKTAEEELKVKKKLDKEDKENSEETNGELDVVPTVEKLKAENDFIKEQCNVIKSKYENLKNANRLSEIEVEGPVADANRIYETLRHTLRNLRDKFREAQDDTPDVQAAICRLNRDIQQSTANDVKYNTEKNILEGELMDLKSNLKADSSIAEHFQTVEAASFKKLSAFMDGVLASNTISKAEIVKDIENNQTDECTLLKSVERSSDGEDKNETYIQLCIYVVTSLQEEIRKAADAARTSKNSKEKTEEKLVQAQRKYLEVSEALSAAENLSSCLRQRLATKEGFMQNKTMYLNDVLDHMTQLESAADHIHSQFYSLANNLAKEREESDKLRIEINYVRSQLEAAEKLSVSVTNDTANHNKKVSSDNLISEQNSETDSASEEGLDSTITEEVTDDDPIGSTDVLKTDVDHTKETLLSHQEATYDVCEENELSPQDSSHAIIDQVTDSLQNPTDSIVDQLTTLKQENKRLRSQLNIQNEEFSDLAMRNQIVVPTWFLTIIIGVLYYSWTFYCYCF